MAAPRHRTHVEAANDLVEALAHVRQEAPDQADRLLALFRAARGSLRRHPQLHGRLYEDYRRVVLVPFKYMVVYVTDGRSTDILAVFHAAREPGILQAELGERTFD